MGKINLYNIFYLIQFIQNIVILTRNPYEKNVIERFHILFGLLGL